MNLQGKRVLVIGASGVLGGEISRLLLEQGATVLGSASSAQSATKIPHGVEVRLLLDLADSNSVRTLSDYLNGSTELDGIINAAGVVGFGAAASVSAEDQWRMFSINAIGPIQLLTALHPLLVKSSQSQREPFVVNLTGVVAELPLANLAHYSASKTAISGFLAALGKEWRREGIRVLSANPPHTETGLAGRAIFGTAPNFGQGLTANAVAMRIIRALTDDEKELSLASFKD